MVVFVFDLNDDLGGLAMREALLADGGCCEGGLVFGGVQSLQLKAIGIAGDLVARPDVKIKARHRVLL
jgi:hypothetical protein